MKCLVLLSIILLTIGCKSSKITHKVDHIPRQQIIEVSK